MYGISTYIYHKKQPNVGKYTIKWVSGILFITITQSWVIFRLMALLLWRSLLATLFGWEKNTWKNPQNGHCDGHVKEKTSNRIHVISMYIFPLYIYIPTFGWICMVNVGNYTSPFSILWSYRLGKGHLSDPSITGVMLSLFESHRVIWGFPKMVVPNNHGFSY